MRKPELAAFVAEKADLSKDKAAEIITLITDHIGETLRKGETVNLVGFGSFNQKSRAARQGKNPKTGEAITIAASKSVAFKPGKALKDSVNQ
ncbi:MAG: HU family DNA-binding protein [Oceanospirillaceae bacterium]|nr:HU family DNA-binding protein [Oceanospirillaceae bacterium]MCP5334711.1 HU family DNA-binding protein [Oceanospirillaceae bacterium]MCP5351295.1 HU family DNA-binding protein [Oceanospirillaceae bacterium]